MILKELLALNVYKINIISQHDSAIVQRILFYNDIEWLISGKTVNYTDKQTLVIRGGRLYFDNRQYNDLISSTEFIRRYNNTNKLNRQIEIVEYED